MAEPGPVPRVPEELRGEYPFTGRLHRTEAGCIHFLDEGSGEPVLLLHGNPSWSFLYRQLVPLLAPRFRCIVPDHLGCGLSEKPGGADYRLSAHIDRLESLVEALGLERFHLVVHDWGGPIGLGLARRRPASLGRVVVTNTAAWPSPWIPGRIALCRRPRLGPWLIRRCNAFAGLSVRFAVAGRPLHGAVRDGFLYPYRSYADRVAVDAFVRDIPMEPDHPTRPELEAIAAFLPALDSPRTLLAWGLRDWCFSFRFLARWRELLPRARCLTASEAGHYLFEEALDTLGPAVRDHLEDTGADS
ncbi:MAG: alpha/beta fold hydrolase [Puniceicoccaceae bacterium]|nr:MAG: alpha/beta fold hydrolase [Puniceicoccaceae bacterium]